jgi:putative aminopeptidase FrvX
MPSGADASDRVFDLLKDVLEIPGPTGQEELVRVWLRERWQGRMAVWHEDPVGNIVCRVGGSGPKLLVQAHMDEIGFVVRYITPEGFLMLDTAQGLRRLSPDRRFMIGQTAQIVGRYGVVAEGIFATASGHTLTQAQLDKPHIDFNDFFVDIGVESRAEAEAQGVHVGAGLIWYRPTARVGKRIVGKAMDDRMLLAIMDLLLDDLDPNTLQYDLWFGATVQEENGVHGARALGHLRSFDLAIALDVGLVGDVPTVEEKEYATRLGGGPTLVHKDSVIHYDRRLLWRLADVAQAHGIPFQHGVYANYSSDAAAFLDLGIPAVLIGTPTRYTHTATEMVDERDIRATVDLLRAFVTTTPAE